MNETMVDMAAMLKLERRKETSRELGRKIRRSFEDSSQTPNKDQCMLYLKITWIECRTTKKLSSSFATEKGRASTNNHHPETTTMAERTPKAKDKTNNKHRSRDKDKAIAKKRKRPISPSAADAPKKARIEIDRTNTTSNASTAADSSNIPYHLTTASLYLSLAPRYSYYPEKTFSHLFSRSASNEQAAHLRSLSPITGVQKHHLDPLLMTYYEPVDGVVIAYDNIRFESECGRINAEAPYPHVWTTVDLLVWRPTKGMVLQGWVNLQSASHIGLLVDNTWNVSIPMARIPEGWKYIENDAATEGGMEVDEAEQAAAAEGVWVGEKGKRVEGLLRFVVESVKAGGSIFIMEGSLLDREKIENAVLP
jgi:DNA-directed RNA polymerase I subunit RPA43